MQTLLGYARWDNFVVAINRVADSCKTQGVSVGDHFREVTKMIEMGKRGIQPENLPPAEDIKKVEYRVAKEEKALAKMMLKGIRTYVICNQGMNVDVVNKDIAQGAQVITFDNNLKCNYTTYVSGNNESLGKLSGEYLRTKSVKKVIAFDVIAFSETSKERIEALRKALGNDIQLEIIDIESFTPEAGRKVLDQVIASDADALWPNDDQVLLGIYEDIKQKAPHIRYISSGSAYQPLLKVIKNDNSGIDLSTVSYTPDDIQICIALAADILKGNMPAQKRIISTSELITKENVDKYIKEGINF